MPNRARIARDRGRDEIATLHRIAEEVALGTPAAVVQTDVERELTTLLSLRGCAFEHLPYDHPLPSFERSGAIETTVHRYVGGDFALPADGVAIPVFVRGVEGGRLVLAPRPDVGVSLEERIVAIALADQLGAVHRPPTVMHTEQRSELMKDVVLVLALLAFFGVCVLYVRAL